MNKSLALVAALTLVGCAAAPIPDNIPPAPPKRTGSPITAPSNAPAEEPAMDGFGGDGFGGVTPTIEVEAPAGTEESETTDEGSDGDADSEESAKSDAAEAESGDAAPAEESQP